MGWSAVWQRRRRGGCCGPALLCLLGLLLLLPLGAVWSQELREGDAACTEGGSCFVLYFQRKTFLYAWRSCKERGGDLATLKDPADAAAVERLFAGADLRRDTRQQPTGKLVRAWIGLQRQPRQCLASRPLRGYSWVTGDQETRFTNWLGEDTPNACTAPRCVVVGYVEPPNPGYGDNLKWTDGPCSIAVDAYLCKYNYKGMCPSISGEGGGNTFYSTPFDLLTTGLTYLPFGSVATVPCPDGTVGDQTVLCTDMSDGTVNWSRESPYCSPKQSWCDQNNGGCHQLCIDKEDMHVCMCIEGYALADDGMSCLPDDPCQDSPCESECVPMPDGTYRCDCPNGYVLEQDERSCRDLDECLQMPCANECINTPGSYECRCLDGYRPDEAGECEDVDECDAVDGEEPCEHACENTLGSHVCHCHLGFAPTPEDPSRCRDIDECQIEDMCHQMCINYEGGFECYCHEGYELQADHFSCEPITDRQQDPTATTPAAQYPWGPILNNSWSFPWGPNPDQAYPTDYEDNTDWTTEHPGAGGQDQMKWPAFRPLVPSPLPEEFDYSPEPVTDSLSQDDSFETMKPHPEFPLVVVVVDPTPVPDLEPLTPSSLPTQDNTSPDWYDYEDDETTVATTTILMTTIIEGARNRLWHFMTEEPLPTKEDIPEDVSAESSLTASPSSVDHAQESPSKVHPGEESPAAGTEEKGEVEVEEGNNWLLVGLLVSLCLLLLVMAVLATIYCTRSSASTKHQNKNSSDCYHWISGAADKAGAEHSGPATKSQV